MGGEDGRGRKWNGEWECEIKVMVSVDINECPFLYRIFVAQTKSA